jgi:ion channel-forming bestrophin family protein
MIIYQSNKNWLGDLKNLFTSSTMKKVVRSTALVMALTALLAYLHLEVVQVRYARLDVTIFSLLGVVLSILLSFRTNTAYDRWWEGRKLWGDLVNHCRNLAVYIHTAFPAEDKEIRRYLAIRIVNFCIVLKEHLRSSVEMKELINVSEKEIEKYASKVHLPSFIAFEITSSIQDVFKAGDITVADHISIREHTRALLNITGACERIRKTPIPFSYNVYLKLFITVYALCLPFALIPVFGYWSIIMVGFIFFAFIGLELMAEEIEDPFGLDCNDLPIGDIAHTIRNNVFEILAVKQVEQEQTDELYSKIF